MASPNLIAPLPLPLLVFPIIFILLLHQASPFAMATQVSFQATLFVITRDLHSHFGATAEIVSLRQSLDIQHSF